MVTKTLQNTTFGHQGIEEYHRKMHAVIWSQKTFDIWREECNFSATGWRARLSDIAQKHRVKEVKGSLCDIVKT